LQAQGYHITQKSAEDNSPADFSNIFYSSRQILAKGVPSICPNPRNSLTNRGRFCTFNPNSICTHMKVFLLPILLLPVLLTGCPPRQSATGGDNTAVTDIPPNNTVVTVSGTVYRTADYCGGAAPSQDLLNELATPKPFPGMAVHVRKGNTNQVGTPVHTSATTDEQGRFTFILPPGTWCLVLDEKGPDAPRDISDEHVQVDDDCYTQWLTRCDEVVEVKSGSTYDLKIVFHQRCHLSTLSNCATWVGPLPPAAPPRRDE
jgi:hypothetical protein